MDGGREACTGLRKCGERGGLVSMYLVRLSASILVYDDVVLPTSSNFFFVVLECGAAVGGVENWGTDGTVAYCSISLPMIKFFWDGALDDKRHVVI